MSDQARARAEALFPQFTALAARALGPAKYRQEVIALLLRYRDEVRQEALEEAMAQSCINSGCRVIDCSREGEPV